MSMIEDNLGKQIDRSVVTKTTLLDIAMNSTHDVQEFNEMLHEYCTILYEYDLWEKPFIEVAEETEYSELEDDYKIYKENDKWGVKESRYHCGLPADYEKIECVDGITYQFLTYRDKHVGLVNLWDRFEVWLEPIFDKKFLKEI